MHVTWICPLYPASPATVNDAGPESPFGIVNDAGGVTGGSAQMARTVADDLLDVLVQAGVTRIYGLVGDSLNAFSDAVRRSGGAAKGGIDWIHDHNEEGAAFAASAEAQLTGRLAVCAGSCGPGNTHLIQGVMDAHRSGAPVLALASHIPRSVTRAE